MKREGRIQKGIWGMVIAVSLFLIRPAYGAVELFDMETQASTSDWEETTAETAADYLPPAADQPETSETPTEPEVRVEEVRIKEKFLSETGIYDDTIQDKYSFRTNVSNGGVTEEQVYFEMPPEITCSLNKDGTAIPYRSGDKLYEPGNYEMNFLIVEQTGENHRVEYQSVFRFKIREKEELVTEEAESEGGENVNPDLGVISPGVSSMGDLYTKSSQDFIHRFDDGLEISSNIPNGAITSEAVYLKMNGNAPFSLFKDEEPIEWKNGMILQENGNYTVITGKESFNFRISKYFTQSRWFYAPEGFRIESVNFKNNVMRLSNTDRFKLQKDGIYDVKLINDDGIIMECTFEKDSIPPEFTVTHRKNGIVVDYQSDDIEEVLVYKDGKEIKPAFNNIYSEAGEYRIITYDRAGNFKDKEFSVAFRMNGFSILLILLTIGIVSMLFGMVYITKNKIKIR